MAFSSDCFYRKSPDTEHRKTWRECCRASYKGEDLLTEDELASIAETLCISRDNLASEGCDFIIYIAPNKERIYADELPDYYGDPADEHAALQIYSYLKTHTDI